MLTRRVIRCSVAGTRQDSAELDLVGRITDNTVGIAHRPATSDLAGFGGVVAILVRINADGVGPGVPRRRGPG